MLAKPTSVVSWSVAFGLKSDDAAAGPFMATAIEISTKTTTFRMPSIVSRRKKAV